MTTRSIFLAAAALAAATAAWLAAQPVAKPAGVKVTFSNTTRVAVDIYGVDAADAESMYAQGLPAGQSVDLDAAPGNVWRVKAGKDVLGEYETAEAPTQFVSLAELVSWQLPVTIDFVNDGDAPVDLFLVGDDGKEVRRAAGLRPGQQWREVSAPAGSGWVVKQDGKIVAEYEADNDPDQDVSLKELLQDYASRVAVTFQNTTKLPVDLLWRAPDGSEELYVPDLPAGQQIVLVSLPEHIWIIRQKGTQIGAYIPGDLRKQVCDIKTVAEVVAAQEKALADADRAAPNGGKETAPKPK